MESQAHIRQQHPSETPSLGLLHKRLKLLSSCTQRWWFCSQAAIFAVKQVWNELVCGEQVNFCERTEPIYNRKLEGTDHAKSRWIKTSLETFSIQIGLCFNYLTYWEVCKPGICLFLHLR